MKAFDPRDARMLRPYPEEIPWDLLLDADPSRARVESYLSDELTRVAKLDDVVIGVYALQRIDATSFELMNIAVAESHQGTGLGRRLLGHAIGLAESKGARVIEVGTGNSSFDALRFYQRAGFRIVGVLVNHFVDNYDEPIYENGIQCIDMVRLRLVLTPE
ncbi:MAG TPA: GNAT family N-acetyltransferase [Pseudomonadales bacterium]